jgi:hypothetical protein
VDGEAEIDKLLMMHMSKNHDSEEVHSVAMSITKRKQSEASSLMQNSVGDMMSEGRANAAESFHKASRKGSYKKKQTGKGQNVLSLQMGVKSVTMKMEEY